jgi:hypothetical protein
MESNKRSTAFFLAQEKEKFPFSLEDTSSPEYQEFIKDAEATLVYALDLGCSTFICGITDRYNFICAQLVNKIRLERNLINIRIVLVMPQVSYEYTIGTCNIYNELENIADNKIYETKNTFSQKPLDSRIDFLFNNSMHMISYYNFNSGRASHLITRATQKGYTVYNIAERSAV